MRLLLAAIALLTLTALGWRAWEQRYAEGYKAGVAELDAKVRAEGDKVTAERATTSAKIKQAADDAVAEYRSTQTAEQEKRNAEHAQELAVKQRTIGRLRDTLATSGSGPLRPDPSGACGTDKLRSFNLDAQLRECQSVSVEAGEDIAEARSIILEDQAGARRDAAVIRLAQRWADSMKAALPVLPASGPTR
jgi:hypothetical protein